VIRFHLVRSFRLRLLCLLLALPPLLVPQPAVAAVDQSTAKYCASGADNVVVYVDRTTNYDAKDKQDLLDGVSAIFGALKGGERFSVRTIADSFVNSQSLVDACMPVCASQGFFGDLFSSSCTEGVAINDRNHLRDHVVGTIETLLNSYSDLPYSEIVRTLALTASSEIRPDQPNHLFLFTDLLENSQYLPGRDFLNLANDQLLSKAESDHLVPDYHGATVKIFGVGRSGLPGRPPLNQHLLSKVMDFWTQYFTAAHATALIQQALSAP
jgi:hypothetical protein